MSVKKEFRWEANQFFRSTERHDMEAAEGANEEWDWWVWRKGESKAIAKGVSRDEKAAKLAARRAADRDAPLRVRASR